jgi:hypothetical protein
MSSWIDLGALGKVLAASLIGGVGLAVFFAVGLYGLSARYPEERETAATINPALGLGVAVMAFAVVALGIFAGLYVVLTD